MRAVVLRSQGSIDALHVEDDFPEPEARAGDAIIEVGATSINGFDPMIVRGTTGLETPLPMIPCGDYAGRIVAFGPDTDAGEWKVGDRVCPTPFVPGEGMTGETRLGAACERVRMPVANLIRTPDAVSDVQAACLPIAYGTAYRMLLERGRVQAGETVLVLGATGGVGVACVQIAKRQGAVVVAVSTVSRASPSPKVPSPMNCPTATSPPPSVVATAKPWSLNSGPPARTAPSTSPRES